MKVSKIKNEATALKNSARFQAAKSELLAAVVESSAQINGIRAVSQTDSNADHYRSLVQQMGKERGRDLYYPFVGSGLGHGPFVELVDGSVKYDMITGIGIHFFGHSHPMLIEEMVEASCADILQGNLEPGIEMHEAIEAILSRVGEKSRLKHAWLMCSGTMVNEVALKIIRQKKAPATKILAFKDCFAGRSTAMQEITDNPGYRVGQPVYGEVHYLSFYDEKLGLARSIERTLSELKEHLARFPGQFAGLMMELVQGEGGFQFAPRDFYVRVFEESKKAGVAIWFDEIQTFGRTGELFAYQTFNLEEYADVVTVAKMLQACVVLYSAEFNPKPGLVAGTFSGSTAALRASKRILECMTAGNLLGKDGHICRLSARFFKTLRHLSNGSCRGLIGEVRGIGGMIAFEPFSGSMEDVKAVLVKLYDLGVICFSCGHGPYLVRMLPPLAAMTEQHVDEVCQVIEAALLSVAKSRQEVS